MIVYLLMVVVKNGKNQHPLIHHESSFDYFREKKKENLVLFSRDLAIAMQNDEQRRAHEAQLRQQQAQGYYYEKGSKKSKKKSRRSSRDYDDDGGCIVS